MRSARPAVTVRKKVSVRFSDDWIRSVLALVLRSVGRTEEVGIGVGLVGDAEMRKLNRKYRRKDKTTDVLSFSSGSGWPRSGDEPLQLGDIIISVPQARRQSKEGERSLRSEMAALLVHGCLHLLGHDHEKPPDAQKMLPLQEKILKKLGYV